MAAQLCCQLGHHRALSICAQLVHPAGAQVPRVKPAYRDMETNRNSLVPNISKFISAAEDPVTARAQGFRWVNWEKHYNHLLMLYTHDQNTNPLPQILSEFASGYQFQLYQIKQPLTLDHVRKP
jgi:hypothetical protein